MGNLMDFWADDITFCQSSDCANKETCFRNPDRRRDKKGPYSVADFSKSCKDYKAARERKENQE